MKINIDLTASTKKAESAFSRFFAKLKGMNNKFGNINKDANRSAQGIAGLTKSFGGLNQAMGMAGFYAFGYGIKSAIQSAMDMTETINLFNVAMGDMAVKTNESLVAMSELSGLDLTNLQQAVGSYALLARSMGMSTEQASVLSESTAKLAIDLSSLANVPVQQAMADLKSGLVGQSETVYKYGIDVTEAGLKAEAMNQGITKSVRDMSQGEKMALRYSAMIRQSALAHGDFAKTINSPANQVKILQERLVTLSRAIGSIFIPMLTVVLPYVNAFVSMLTKLARAIASFFGYEPPPVQNISNNLGDATEEATNAGDSLSDATKEAKKFFSALVGIDEINLLPQESIPSDSGSGDGAGQSILPDMELPSYDNLMAGVKTTAGEIEGAMQGVIDKFIELSKPLMFANWDILKDSVDDLWDSLTDLANIIWDALLYFYENILVPLGVWLIEKGLPASIDLITSAFNFLNSALEALSPLGKDLFEYVLKPIAEFAGDVFILTMEGITSALNGISDWISNNKESFRGMIEIIALFFGAWKVTELLAFIQQSGGIVSALTEITGAVKAGTVAKLADKAETIALTALYAKDFIVSIIDATAKLTAQIVEWGLLTGAKIWDAIKTEASIIATNAMKIAQVALNVAMSANPIMLVVTALGLLVTAFITAYNKCDWFKEFVDTAMSAIAGFFQVAIDLIVGYFSTYKGAIDTAYTKIVDFKNNVLGVLGSIQSYFHDKITAVTGYWNNLKTSVNDAYNKVKGVKDNIGGLLTGIKDSVWNNIQSKSKAYFDNFKSSIAGAYDKAKGVRDNIGGVFTSIKDKAWSNIQDKSKKYFDNFKDSMNNAYNKAKGVKDNIGGVLTSIKDKVWNNIQDKSVKYFDNMKIKVGNVYDKLKTLRDDGGGAMGTLKTKVVTAIDGMSGKWYKIEAGASTIWSNIKTTFKNGGNDVIYYIERFVNGAVDGFNRVIDVWNRVKSDMGISGWTYHIDHISIPRLARGGSLERGQIFEAGELGKAEMIGSHKGKTTVMPLENTDFVSAIGTAVFSAVTSAIGSSGNNSGEKELVLKVGETEFGRVAINSINNITRKDGRLALKI